MDNTHKTIENILNVLCIFFAVFAMFCFYMAVHTVSTKHVTDRYYVTAATVTDVDYRNDYITAVNHSRTFYIDSIDDWQVGDIVAIMLDGHNTDTVTDDSIVQTQYVRMDREEYGVWIINTTR